MKSHIITFLCFSHLFSLSNQIQFISPEKTQLGWKEYKSPDIIDGMEWGDEDINFTKTHPDWGADDNVKNYFADAQNRPKRKEYKFPDDDSIYEDRYRAINVNSMKEKEK